MDKTEFFYAIKAAEKRDPFYNITVGRGKLYASSIEEAKEEGKKILSLPQSEREKVITFNDIFRNAKKPFRFRMELLYNGKFYYIHENKKQNSKDMSKKQIVTDYFDNVMGGGEAPQVKNEEAAPQEPEKRGKGRPREDGYESRTFRVKTEHVQKLKLIALKEGRLQKDILDFALESIITRYEAKHGALNIDEEQDNIESIF